MDVKRTAKALAPVALAALGYLAIGPVQLGGPAAYVIVDGESMEPTYESGDLIVTREQSSYEVGDIVTFVAPDSFDSGFRVIHRITDTTAGGYVTQGDNRREPDPWTLRNDDIIGSAQIRLPLLGMWLTTLRSSPLLLGAFAGIVAFILMLPNKKKAAAETYDAIWTAAASPKESP